MMIQVMLQTALIYRLDKCTTHSTFVGFKLINTFNNILNQCTAISTDTGFLITGNGAGGGTSSTYNNCLTYNSRIGWDFDAIGWGYSGNAILWRRRL